MMMQKSLLGEINMTKELFYSDIMYAVFEKPRYWRNGQTVYNYVNAKYKIADLIRDDYNINCFYDDSQIMSFINKAYELINKK